MPSLFAADSTAEAPRFRARAGCFQMLSTDDGFQVIPITGAGPSLRAQMVAFHLETPRSAIWAPADQKGLFHFLIGDPSGWRPRVPAYDHLTWPDASPGVDVRLTCEGGAPRYDLLVDHPAAVNDLSIRVEGADGLGATDGSSLPIPTPAAQANSGGSKDMFVATFLVP
ncbi:MAG: hypothetical protein HY812_09870 [Planctomycetes bacterium]|nr:hypothetical protein [Planctomycetota bacterium]